MCKPVTACFCNKSYYFQSVFRTLPGPKIARLETGGPVGGLRDRIFVAVGSDIRGYSKKGKQFLNFNTNLTEAVQSLWAATFVLFIYAIHVPLCQQKHGSYVHIYLLHNIKQEIKNILTTLDRCIPRCNIDCMMNTYVQLF